MFLGGNAVYFFRKCIPRQPSIAGGCRKSLVVVPAALFIMHLSLAASAVRAQTALNPPLPDLTGIVKSKEWALVLGKAFFWDQRVGSDGNSIEYSGQSSIISPKGESIFSVEGIEAIRTTILSANSLQAYRDKFPAFMDADDFSIEFEHVPEEDY